jgi:hypothetical protein
LRASINVRKTSLARSRFSQTGIALDILLRIELSLSIETAVIHQLSVPPIRRTIP